MLPITLFTQTVTEKLQIFSSSLNKRVIAVSNIESTSLNTYLIILLVLRYSILINVHSKLLKILSSILPDDQLFVR